MRMLYERIVDIRGVIATFYSKEARLGELVRIHKGNGTTSCGVVTRIEGQKVTIQIYKNTLGLSIYDKVELLHKRLDFTFSTSLLGRVLNAFGEPLDGKAPLVGHRMEINTKTFNPMHRSMACRFLELKLPVIDMFNCLVESQKIPVFATQGSAYHELMMRIANSASADVIVIGLMKVRYDDFCRYMENAERSGSKDKTVIIAHLATDPSVECMAVPDIALSISEKFAASGLRVLTILTDMTAFADALKELCIMMDLVPSNRGYPGSLYTELAQRYEKATSIEGTGSVTILTTTTMPGDDVTHPIPDNTGYITEGQFYLEPQGIDIFRSLSRLKQNVIGKTTRSDHGDVANTLVRLYADAKKAEDRQSMGFRLSRFDEKLLRFALLLEKRILSLDVTLSLNDALDESWKILAECFDPSEVGMKMANVEKYWGTVSD